MKHPKQGKLIERRNGQEGFAWGGVASKVDPAGNPPDRPRDLVNVRLQGGAIISRPDFLAEGTVIPLFPNHDVQVPADPGFPERLGFRVGSVRRWNPHWAGETASGAGVRLWMTAAAATGGEQGYLHYLDSDADPVIQTLARIKVAPFFTPPMEKFNNEFYIGDYGALRKIYLVQNPAGFQPYDIVDLNRLSDEIIVSYPDFQTTAMLEHDGMLFFAIGGAPNGSIYHWDGLGITQEFVMASTGTDGMAMAVYKDTLCVSVRTAGVLLVRDATGAWTTNTIGGFDCSGKPQSMVEYGNLLYIMGGDDKIYTWDGTTLALAYTIITGTPTKANVCAKLAGRLYFCWTDNNVDLKLGFVDQDSTVDTYRDDALRTGKITDNTEIGASPDAQAMCQYRGRLYVSPGGIAGRIFYHSQQFVPYDGWQITASNITLSDLAPTDSYLLTDAGGGVPGDMRTL